MKTLLKLEQLGLFLLSLLLFSQIGHAWWVFLALLLMPDLAMLGCRFGPVAGAAAYNSPIIKAWQRCSLQVESWPGARRWP
jgi:hypothetical protein